MNMNNDLAQVSKFLSYVLRHQPEAIGIDLDREGWVDIATLIQAADKHGTSLTEDLIKTVVHTSDKKRFALSDDNRLIRAVQGHSTHHVDIAYTPKTPPPFLYHGTATRFLQAILQEGLKPQSRQYVHLSQDEATALNVGERHGKPVILKIDVQRMHEQGTEFFQAENGVWLVASVPASAILVS